MRRCLRACAIVCCALSLLRRPVDAYGRLSRCSACDVSATINGTSTKLRDEMIGGGGGGAGTMSRNGRLVADEGRGKKKKKNASVNMMIGGSVIAGLLVVIAFSKVITITLVKAFLFTFIAKFLVSTNWISSGSSSKKKSDRKDVMVVVEYKKNRRNNHS